MKKLPLLVFVFSILQSFLAYSSGQSAINFAGNDSYISIENSPETSLSAFTIECWFMRKDTGVAVITGTDSIYAVPLIAKGIGENPGVPNMNYFLGIRKEDSILIAGFEESAAGSNPGENHHILGFTTIHRNIWYHAAVTYDGAYIKLYLNGILESALEINEPPATASPVNTAAGSVLLAGDMPEGSFNGSMDEIRIWNYAKSQEEINDKINEEISSVRPGLVAGLCLNEGTGDEILYTGTPGLNVSISGSGWSWTAGSPFENINPPLCNNLPAFKAGLIADPQYCDCDPSGTRFYRETINKLPAAIDTLNKYEVDFVVTLGDFIDRDFESFNSVLPFYNNLNMPDYRLLGNHEFEYTEEIYKDSVMQLLNIPDYYYDFSYSGWRFIVLDGTELAEYDSLLHPDLRDEGDSLWQSIEGQINALTWNGGIGRKQRSWLENKIQDAADNNENVILFCHFPVYPFHRLNLWNSEQIIEIVEKYDNVAAYINGHNHDGNYGFLNGKHYITQKGMVETAGNNSFSILEIYDNHLVFNSYGLMDNHVIRFRNINKKPYDIILSNNTLTYAFNQGDFVSKISVVDSSGSTSYSCTLTDTYSYAHNSLFTVSGDSLFLAASQDLSHMGPLSVRIAAMNCFLDTVTKILSINFDTIAAYLDVSIPDTTLILGSGNLTADLDSVIADKSKYGLAYTAHSSNTRKATAAIEDGNLVVEPVAGGESTVIFSGSDSFTGQSVADTFNVVIIDPLNHIPGIIMTIEDVVVNLYRDTLYIDLDTVFFDEDGDTLNYTLLFDNDSTVNFGLINSLLEISPAIAGDNYLQLSAGDDRGGSACLGFGIIVNTMPEVLNLIPDLFLQEHDPPVFINLDTIFHDKDCDSLYYEITADDTAVIAFSINEQLLELEPVLNGHTAVDIVACDDKGGFAGLTFSLNVNGCPQLDREIADMILTLGAPPVHIDLDTVFTDPDGDTLQYETYNSNPEILDAVLAGHDLAISAISEGATDMEISAYDQRGGTFSCSFSVSVSGVNVVYNPGDKFNINICPNPFSDKTRLAFNLSESGVVRLSLYSQYGQLIKVLVSELRDAGKQEVYISAEDLCPGIYFCRLEAGDKLVYIKKIVICK